MDEWKEEVKREDLVMEEVDEENQEDEGTEIDKEEWG